MLMVRQIKYSQIYNFWQWECEMPVRYFFSIPLISIPPFHLSSSRNYSKDFFLWFWWKDFQTRINKYQIVALAKAVYMSQPIPFSSEVSHIISGL